MKTLDRLYHLLVYGHITPEEYEKKREQHEQRLFKLYQEGRITLEELLKRIEK